MQGLFNRENSVASMEIRARWQRAGYLHKLPMSQPEGQKWQRRLFVAKDGFLLYYAPTGAADAPHFDTKAKGAIPLGGCKVDLVERGPKGGKFGLKVSHPDFYAGRMLILAADTLAEQKAWQETLLDCSRVTMENAKLGDALIEKMRASGPEAEKAANDAMLKLQAQAMALKIEQEEMMKKHMDVDTLKKMAAEAEERARKREEELAAMNAEMERRRAEVEAHASEIQAAIDQRAAELVGANAEYDAVQRQRAAGGAGGGAALDDRASSLEDQKLRLEREKAALERSVKELQENSRIMRSDLDNTEEMRAKLQSQLENLSAEDTDLLKERQMRKRLERKLQIAEDSLKRLDAALKRNGVKMDVDVFADVKTLLSFFEERVDEVRRDAQRIDIMKKALVAKRRYLVASAKADSEMSGVAGLEEAGADDDSWGDDDTPSMPQAHVPAAPVPAAAAAFFDSSAAPPPPPPPPAEEAGAEAAKNEDGWGDDDDS